MQLSVKAQIVKETIQQTATDVDEKLGITNKAKVVAHTFTGLASTIGGVFDSVADKTKAVSILYSILYTINACLIAPIRENTKSALY